MSGFDLKQALGKPMAEIKRAPLIPRGAYKWLCLGTASGESSQKKTPCINFTLKMIEAGPDVDQDQLMAWEAGMKEAGQDPKDFQIVHPFWISTDPSKQANSLVMLKEAVEQFGVSTAGTLAEAVADTAGQMVWATVNHEANPERAGVYNARLSDFAKI